MTGVVNESLEGFVNRTNFDSSNCDKLFDFITNVVISGLLSIIGLIWNPICFFTLGRIRRMSVPILLQGLAVADTLFNLYSLFYTSLRSVYPYNGALKGYHAASPYIVAYCLPIGWIAQTSSIWMVCVIAFDRYMAICHPFSSHKWCTTKVNYLVIT